jgi:elongator complex protein 5
MISTYDTQLADADLAAVLATPGGIEHLILVTGEIPNWLVELYDQRLGLKHSVPTPRPRVKDCNSWIKKNNRYTGGIRKRRIETKHSRGMARPTTQAQYQRHSIHLMSRVLDLRTNASPFTVILDDLNQRAQPFVHELTRRGLSRNVNVVFVAFETAGNVHPSVRHIPAWGEYTGDEILQELARAMDDFKESLVIVDSLYDLLSVKGVDMGALFNLVSGKYASTLIGVYHTDITASQYPENAYAPQSLDIIKYMATTVISCKSFAHVLAIKAAKERSLAEPTHGLLQGAEGIVQCLDANDHRGVVLEAEFRRKSGRPESETFFLRTARRSDYNEPTAGMPFGTLKKEYLVLLDQVPAYNSAEVTLLVNAAADDIESTFNLGLTDKQKEAREGVVLPYFDAQKGEGGEGGRILYDMGEEDDFDEEEDEI